MRGIDNEVSRPRRPEPGRGRGRPPAIQIDAEPLPASLPPPERPMTPIERRSINYNELAGAMAHLELTIRGTRRALDALARGEPVSASSSSDSETGVDDGVHGDLEGRLQCSDGESKKVARSVEAGPNSADRRLKSRTHNQLSRRSIAAIVNEIRWAEGLFTSSQSG
jgi:hypothetical protein